jgi:hypothetical protein
VGLDAGRDAPEINVLGTLIFIVAVGGMLANVLLQTGRAKAG